MALDDQGGRWTLPADTDSPATARHLVATLVGGTPAADDIVLVTSELVTNAVRYGSGPIDLAVAVSGESLRIEVASASAGEPAARHASSQDPGGRGLALVEALARRWGWLRDTRGLVVWAEFDRT